MKFCVSLIMVLMLPSTILAEDCPTGYFGRKCRYSCHCSYSSNCDVISGECSRGCATGWSGPSCQRENIAYKRPCRQKEGQASQNASLAVDDETDTCSATKADVPGWWTLTLDDVKLIESFTLVTDYLSDFYDWRVYVGLDDAIFSMTLCITIQLHDNGATFKCQEPVVGRYVTVINRAGPVLICDFQIFDCSPFTFDKMCTKTCNCLDFTENCDTKAGLCSSGCDSGWTGPDCYTECDNHYGQNCAYPCGRCLNGKACDRFIGTCSGGCQPGWTGLLCNQRCPENRYGISCAEACGHCYHGTSCNPVNGTCEKGCDAGWGGASCNGRCAGGFFGENCAHACGHCLSGLHCDPVSGVCEDGCQHGWEGLFCTQECLPGFFGKSCLQNCQFCLHGVCHKETGQCTNGCEPGRRGVNCSEECDLDAYGINCSSKCDRCIKGKGRLCNFTDGACTYGCLPGFNGTNCLQECPVGLFGSNCASQCGACKAGTTCDKVSGKCHEGCAGKFYGDQCIESDPFEDIDGPQLQIFLGTTLGIVGSLMTVVIICLVLVWKREHLPKIQVDEPESNKPIQLEEQNGRLLTCSGEEESEIEEEI